MTTAHTARPPRRKLGRSWDSRPRSASTSPWTGQLRRRATGASSRTHRALQLQTATGELRTLPGVTVEVRRWEGVDYHGAPGTPARPQVQAHDSDTRRS